MNIASARPCGFLCAGDADHLNGTAIGMDGGTLPGVPYEVGLETIRERL